jgi:phosphoribosylaminoimidazole-succinocarboxamide synthase
MTQRQKIAEGKTKIIYATGRPHQVHIVSKDDITAGDGLQHDLLASKAVLANRTTCNVFRLLGKPGGVWTHFLDSLGDDGFVAKQLDMIPLELVARRIATGSYIKRHPEVAEGTIFPDLEVEFFYKDDTLSPPEAGLDTLNDPLVVFDLVGMKLWRFKPKRPASEADSFIDAIPLVELEWLPGNIRSWMPDETAQLAAWLFQLKRLTVNVFSVLAKAWSTQGIALVDLKIECGYDTGTGELVVGDVIDNDSWRLWPGGDKGQMLDKQVYRELEGVSDPEARAKELGKIKDNYARVAEMTETFVD